MKRLVVTFLLSALVLGLASSASALMPESRSFDTWTGSGNTSVSIGYERSAFVELAYGSEVFDPSNYTVSGTDGHTIITLKQEYLETLANGGYSYRSLFIGEGLRTYSVELSMQTETEAIAIDPHYDFVPTLDTWELMYGDDKVDSIHYEVELIDDDTALFTFDEEYIAGLSGAHSFHAFYSQNGIYVDLNLFVDVPATTDGTPPTTNKPPQTGDDSDTLAWMIVLLVSLIGVCATLLWRKNWLR